MIVSDKVIISNKSIFRCFFSVFICFFLQSNFIFGQFKNEINPFISPIDFEIKLSGNFAELRGNHFHTGIDIKTKGTTGHNIYSIYDGYVTRIKVSPYGYGNALYVRHPNGYTSVYAHLKCFNIQIERYVRKQQYDQKSFALNLYPEQNLIKVSKGDVMGKSGNSGGSLGPHLHFEIRTTKNGKPQNPMFWDFNIQDNVKPKFHRLILYPLSTKAHVANNAKKKIFSLKKIGGKYVTKKNLPIEVADTIGIAVHVNDYVNKSHNRCGVHQLMVYADNELIYHLKLDELDFSENRYILSHMDYSLKLGQKIKAHKCYVDEGNKFSGYEVLKDNGKLFLASGVQKSVVIKAIDVYGNISEAQFVLKGVDPLENTVVPAYAAVFSPETTNYFQRDNIQLTIFPNSLYKKLYFTYDVRPGEDGMLSKIHTLHNYFEPIHKYYNVRFKTYNVSPELQKKLFVAGINSKGKPFSVASNLKYEDGWVQASLRQFGSFCIMADTIKPLIKPINIVQNKDMSNENNIIIDIDDKETGIGSYNGYINDTWVLFEYDAKNNRLKYEFDEHMPNTKSFILKIIVSDKKKNTTVKTFNFMRTLSQTKK